MIKVKEEELIKSQKNHQLSSVSNEKNLSRLKDL